MINRLAYTLVLGQPVIMYGGIITLILLVTTAVVGYLNFKGIHVIPFRWHPRLAMVTIVIAIVHALFGLSSYFSF